MDSTVRPFRPGDREACIRIYGEARRAAFHWMPPDQFRDQDFDRDTAGEVVLVAEKGGRILGFVSGRDRFVHTLFVDPPLRGQGLGSLLLDSLLSRIGTPATLRCVLGNLPARLFYEKRGWAPAGEGRDAMGPWILYRKFR